MRGSDRVDWFSLAIRGNTMENKQNKNKSCVSEDSKKQNAEVAETSSNSRGPYEYNTIEEVDSMSHYEMYRARISRGSKAKAIKLMAEKGINYIAAKRIVFKEDFLRKLAMKDLKPAPYVYKRFISENSTLSTKRHKIDKLEEESHQEVLTTEKIAVVHNGFPEVRIDPEKLDAVQSSIIAAYEKIPSHGPKVRLVESISRPGYLEMTCADGMSANWLKFTVPTLQPWDGAVLTTLDGNKVPKWIACSIYVSDENGVRLEPEKILKRLRVCNGKLYTRLWRVHGTIAKEKGQVWIFMVDEKSLEEIKKLNMSSFFGLRMITFQIMELEPNEWKVKNDDDTETLLGSAEAKKADSKDVGTGSAEAKKAGGEP